jgi:8-oxo-dGTP diphosphatase
MSSSALELVSSTTGMTTSPGCDIVLVRSELDSDSNMLDSRHMIRCVGAVLVQNGKVLLGLRSARPGRTHAGTWDVVGGHCEQGESDEHGLRRELDEELGIRPINYRSLGVLVDPPNAPTLSCHLFVVSEWEGSPENRSDEHSELAWHDPSALCGLPLATSLYLEWLPRALA